jgi:glutamyl-tRNA synthetase
MKVRTRIAPSPTGEYHIGHIRTVLYNYALAKKYRGQFILRIEDTDRVRYVPGTEEKIMQVIKAYGLSWDEGPDIGGKFAPYVQTQRLEIYKKYAQELIDKGNAYYCFCTSERLSKMREAQKKRKTAPRYDRCCLKLSKEETDRKSKSGAPYVIRLKVPENETISFNDLIRGEVQINSNDVDDQVLIKSDGIPTYHLAVVVDDHLMEITHVLRGEEWISSMPKQVLLYRYLGWEMPVFAHLTVLLDPSGHGKMSKRRGSVFARQFLEDGYLPEAVLNFLMLLGWNPGTDQEIFSLDEFIQAFSLDNLHKKAPVFDRAKLDHLNNYYLCRKTNNELAKLLKPFLPELSIKQLAIAAPLIKERIKTLKEARELLEFVWACPDCPREMLLQKIKDCQIVKEMLAAAKEIIAKFGIDETKKLQEEMLKIIKERGWNTGCFFMVLRVAVCAKPITPPILESLPLIGKEESLSRIKTAIDKLK